MIKPRVDIERWKICRGANSPREFVMPSDEPNGCLIGLALNHPRLGQDYIYTSKIVRATSNTVETMNTIYVLLEPDEEYWEWVESCRESGL